jgi:hypothetical protein
MISSKKIEPGLYETEDGHRIESVEHRTGEVVNGWLLTYSGDDEPEDHVYETKASALSQLDDSVPLEWPTWTCTAKGCDYSSQQPPGVLAMEHLCGKGKRSTKLKKEEVDGYDLI